MPRRPVEPARPAALPLRGRANVVHAVNAQLRSGQSVLLVGPEAVGKSAIATAVARPDVLLLDPLQKIGRQLARTLRYRLDSGHVAVATARTRPPGRIAGVGRILWRFRTIHVPPVPAAVIRQIIRDTFRHEGPGGAELPESWWRDAIAAANGRPGYAVAIARDTARTLAKSGLWRAPKLIVIDYRITLVTRAREP